MNNEKIIISLTKDEALVLCEFFGRFEQTDQFELKDNAEYIAFSRISAQLDKALVEPFMPNYGKIIDDAKGRIADGYEGKAPGVK